MVVISMPELPSVEIFKKYFDSHALNQTIKEVRVSSPEILSDIKVEDFKNFLTEKKFTSTSRYGKYLFSTLNKGFYLFLHFGMTGFLRYRLNNEPPDIHERLTLIFNNEKSLSFVDPRKFGKVGITPNLDHFLKEKKLGPDALHLDYHSFKKLFENRNGALKPLLLNQNFIAGIGNLYADEILYQSSLHPLTKASTLKESDLWNLYRNIVRVLRKAIEYQDKLENFPDEYLLAHRYKGGECPEKEALKVIKVSGRTTYFCPRRQKIVI